MRKPLAKIALAALAVTAFAACGDDDDDDDNPTDSVVPEDTTLGTEVMTTTS